MPTNVAMVRSSKRVRAATSDQVLTRSFRRVGPIKHANFRPAVSAVSSSAGSVLMSGSSAEAGLIDAEIDKWLTTLDRELSVPRSVLLRNVDDHGALIDGDFDLPSMARSLDPVDIIAGRVEKRVPSLELVDDDIDVLLDVDNGRS